MPGYPARRGRGDFAVGASGRARRRRPLACEALEPRCLLSGGKPLPLYTTLPSASLPEAQSDTNPVEPDLLNLAEPTAAGVAGTTVDDGLSANLENYDDAGRVGVTISATNPEALVAPLQAMGANVTGVDQADHMMDVFVPVDRLPNLASLSGDGLLTARAMGKPQAGTGSVDSEGDSILETQRLRGVNGLTGTGETVGIMSDSFNVLGGYSQDVATGDLPPNVDILQEGPSGSTDEGRAMSQIVYDEAPGVNLAFYSADFGQTAFAQGIEDLANPAMGHAQVIADDVFYFAEPFFQNGVIGQAINTVVNQGVVDTSLAGNLGNNAYENTNATTTTDPFYTGNGSEFLNFGTSSQPNDRQELTLTAGQEVTLTLEWSNPFYNTAGDTSSLGIYLANPGGAIVAGSNDNTLGSGQPYQTLSYQNTTGSNQNLDLLVFDNGTSMPQYVKWVNFGANDYGPVQVDTFATNSPTIISHGAASEAIQVGAAPYFNQTVPESYSSFGPMTILYSPDGTTTYSTPQTMDKPDVSGVDGVQTTFFPSPSDPYFFGTSAATPGVAAIAALYLEANPGATPAEVKSALVDSGRTMVLNANDSPTGSNLASPDQVGAGLVDAFRAVNGAPVPAAISVADNLDLATGLNDSWGTTNRFTGQTLVTGIVGPVSPVSAPNQLVLSVVDNVFGFGGASEADLYVAGPSSSDGNDLGISFQASAIGGLPAGFSMPASFSYYTDAIGVAISTDGTNWYRVQNLSGASTSYTLSRLNLSQVASANGLSLGSGFQLRFEAVTLAALPNEGLAFDNIRVTQLAAAGPGKPINELAGQATGSLASLGIFTDGLNPVGTYTATINWGDNSGSSAATVGVTGNQIIVSTAGHSYATGGHYTYTITLTDTATGRMTTETGTAVVAANVTSLAKVVSSGLYYSRSLGAFTGTITITALTTLTGTGLELAFFGLTNGVTLDPSVSGAGSSTAGTPYLFINLSSPLQAGQSVTVNVRFLSAKPVGFSYTSGVYLSS